MNTVNIEQQGYKVLTHPYVYIYICNSINSIVSIITWSHTINYYSFQRTLVEHYIYTHTYTPLLVYSECIIVIIIVTIVLSSYYGHYILSLPPFILNTPKRNHCLVGDAHLLGPFRGCLILGWWHQVIYNTLIYHRNLNSTIKNHIIVLWILIGYKTLL